MLWLGRNFEDQTWTRNIRVAPSRASWKCKPEVSSAGSGTVRPSGFFEIRCVNDMSKKLSHGTFFWAFPSLFPSFLGFPGLFLGHVQKKCRAIYKFGLSRAFWYWYPSSSQFLLLGALFPRTPGLVWALKSQPISYCSDLIYCGRKGRMIEQDLLFTFIKQISFKFFPTSKHEKKPLTTAR